MQTMCVILAVVLALFTTAGLRYLEPEGLRPEGFFYK